MQTPELGLLLLPSNDVRRVLEIGTAAEDLSFDCIWIPDERFYREPFELLAVLASRTERARLGPCVVDPYSRNPTLTAVAIATLDEISDGRALLGIGAGVSGFRELGLVRDPAPVPAVRDAVERVRRHLHDTPRPSGRPGLDFQPRRPSVPIYIAAEGPGMLQLSGRMADGVILQAKVAPQLFNTAANAVRRSAAAAERSVRLVARVDVSLAPSLSPAYDALRPRVARRLIASAPAFEPFRLAGLSVPDNLRALAADLPYTNDASVLNVIGRAIPDEFVDAFCVASTPEGLGQRLDALVSAGADQVLVHPVPNAEGPVEAVLESAAAWAGTRRTLPASG